MKFKWTAIGHETQKKFLEQAMKNGRIAHAYLFTGPAHVGKTAVALDFARFILCEGKNRPCGECGACRRELGASSDFFLLDQEGGISIDQIRSLKSRFSFKPFAGKKKIAVIANAENLDAAAANALLKIFEEPGGETVIILTCSKIGALPATIRSRAQRLIFSPVYENYALPLREAKKTASPVSKVAGSAFGRPGIMRRLTQESEFYDQWQEREGLLNKLLSAGDLEKLQIASDLAGLETEDLESTLEQWLISISSMLVKNQAGFPAGKLLKASKMIFGALQDLRLNANKRLVLDNALLHFKL